MAKSKSGIAPDKRRPHRARANDGRAVGKRDSGSRGSGGRDAGGRDGGGRSAGVGSAGVGSGGRGGGLWLYGAHAVRAALANPRRQSHRLVATAEAAAELQGLQLPKNLDLQSLSRDEISRLLPEGAVHQGLALQVAPLPNRPLDSLLAQAPGSGGERQVLLVLDQVTDPQNCGAVLRSAAAFGALAVIAPVHHAAPESGALAKAASGALELVPRVAVGNLAQGLRQIQAAGYWVLGLAEEGTTVLAAGGHDDFGPKVALVLGAEGRGLRRLTRETCDLLVRLPTRPALPSLNVSNAAAVALFALLGR